MFSKKKSFSTSIIYFVVVLFTLVVRISFSFIPNNIGEMSSDNLFAILIQIGVFGLLPFSMYLILNRDFSYSPLNQFDDMCWRFGFAKKVGAKNWLKTIVITILTIFTAQFVSIISQTLLILCGFNIPQASPTVFNGVGDLFLQLFMVAVLPAFFEEFTHRGLLISGFQENNSKNVLKVILMSALLFSLMHQNIRQTGYTFYDGLILATLFCFTKSIWPSIFLHFVNNAFSIFSEYVDSTVGSTVSDQIFGWFTSGIGQYFLYAILVMLAMFAIIWLLVSMKEENDEENQKLAYQSVVLKNVLKTKIVFDTKRKKSKCQSIAFFACNHRIEEFSVSANAKEKFLAKTFLCLIVVVGIACAVMSFVWGLLR